MFFIPLLLKKGWMRAKRTRRGNSWGNAPTPLPSHGEGNYPTGFAGPPLHTVKGNKKKAWRHACAATPNCTENKLYRWVGSSIPGNRTGTPRCVSCAAKSKRSISIPERKAMLFLAFINFFTSLTILNTSCKASLWQPPSYTNQNFCQAFL